LRTKARLAFLIDDWGVRRFRRELERRVDRPLFTAGKDVRMPTHTDHVGIFRQKQASLNYVGLAVPVGRMTSEQMFQVADVAENYGSGQIRLTVGQNIIIPNVHDNRIGELTDEPLLKELRYDPSEVSVVVSCTGMDYCHFALIETKGWALKTARTLEAKLGKTQPLRMHWSGCPAGCGNHAVADIGLLGKNVKVNGEVIEAVDVFAGGGAGCEANPPIKIMEDVPCEDLPNGVAGLARHGAFKAMGTAKNSQPAAGEFIRQLKRHQAEIRLQISRIGEAGSHEGEEMAVFRSNGQLYGVQNICPHEGGQLCKGWIEDGEVVCPLHGYKFNLKTGSCSTDPNLKVKVFKLIVQGDQFTVEG
jgi:ferredoxin-nitrite reductase